MKERLQKNLIEIDDIKVGNGKSEMINIGKWDCESCKWKRICLMEGKLKNGVIKLKI
jgi:hypothetical protein